MTDRIARQERIEEHFSKQNIHKAIMDDIKSSNLGDIYENAVLAIETYKAKKYSYDSKNERVAQLFVYSDDELCREVIASICLSTEPQPIQSVAARLASKLHYVDSVQGITTAAELLAVTCISGLFDIYAPNNSETGMMQVHNKLNLSFDVLDRIDRSMFLPPMLCKPNKLTSNKDRSHLTGTGSVILGKFNHGQHKQNLDHLNTANAVALQLDLRMLKHEELPNFDEAEDLRLNQSKLDQFNQMVAESKIVYAEMVASGNEFYLTNRYDYRGRTNTRGYHINTQSTDYKKSLMMLKTEEVISV